MHNIILDSITFVIKSPISWIASSRRDKTLMTRRPSSHQYVEWLWTSFSKATRNAFDKSLLSFLMDFFSLIFYGGRRREGTQILSTAVQKTKLCVISCALGTHLYILYRVTHLALRVQLHKWPDVSTEQHFSLNNQLSWFNSVLCGRIKNRVATSKYVQPAQLSGYQST